MNAKGFVIIPANVMSKLPDIGPNALAVYAVLAECRNEVTKACFPSRATIIARTSISRASVDRAILNLKRVGLIAVTRRGCMESNDYELFSESSPVSSHESSPASSHAIVSPQNMHSESSKSGKVSPHQRATNKTKVTRQKNKTKAVVAIPENLDCKEFREAWQLWTNYRAETKKALAPTTIKLQMKKLSEIGPVRAAAAIEHSIANSWQGIFEEKQNKPTVIHASPNKSNPARRFYHMPSRYTTNR